jgi:hypothetical protein
MPVPARDTAAVERRATRCRAAVPGCAALAACLVLRAASIEAGTARRSRADHPALAGNVIVFLGEAVDHPAAAAR